MENYQEKSYKIFEMFRKQGAILAAGTLGDNNGCMIGWGSLGTLWTRPDSNGEVCTVYIYPSRYTTKYLLENKTFTVSFFPEEYKKQLFYMGTHSGRDENKTLNAGLTPIKMEDSISYKEANLVIYCKKIYMHQFNKEDLDASVIENYKNRPNSYPVDSNGNWQSHYMIVGEILKVIEK